MTLEKLGEAELAQLAREGRLDELYAYSAAHPETAYKWLLYAEDLGMEEAGEVLSDIEEHRDAFHYDDGFAVATAHRHLAAEYFAGTNGVEADFERGCRHLDEFLFATFDAVLEEEAVRSEVTVVRKEVTVVRNGAVADIAEQLDLASQKRLLKFVAELPFRLVERRVDRLRRLRELSAPYVIVENEYRLLRESVDAIARLLEPAEKG